MLHYLKSSSYPIEGERVPNIILYWKQMVLDIATRDLLYYNGDLWILIYQGFIERA